MSRMQRQGQQELTKLIAASQDAGIGWMVGDELQVHSKQTNPQLVLLQIGASVPLPMPPTALLLLPL